MDFQLYVILDRRNFLAEPENLLKKIIKAGCSSLQYRDKISSTRDFFYLAKKFSKLAKEKNIPFIINDKVDIALALDADGVHLGETDLPANEARRLLGPDKIIGKSVHNLQEAIAAEKEGANYVGIGPVFKSQTKIDQRPLISREILCLTKDRLKIPLVAIGGIKAENIQELTKIGIGNFAISADILTANDPTRQIKIIKEKIKSFKSRRF